MCTAREAALVRPCIAHAELSFANQRSVSRTRIRVTRAERRLPFDLVLSLNVAQIQDVKSDLPIFWMLTHKIQTARLGHKLLITISTVQHAPTACKFTLVEVQSLNMPLRIQGTTQDVVEHSMYPGSYPSSDVTVTDEMNARISHVIIFLRKILSLVALKSVRRPVGPNNQTPHHLDETKLGFSGSRSGQWASNVNMFTCSDVKIRTLLAYADEVALTCSSRSNAGTMNLVSCNNSETRSQCLPPLVWTNQNDCARTVRGLFKRD
ncbi:hypothetical protein T265_03248 [Opisthorchis viverrini]|uniref:Reverse transcriptase domain-containing protein n=1 Tax=Opisthorchis viverrini TaxID=6198 RepID=A0A075A404_OPIVI|nr:hypothetical protein T265_03248 [Opisthorchis viverrini]KER30300.1 hypothetical protein T265_03248 [Opisthorchis viverrini]